MIDRLLALAAALWLSGCGAPEREWPAPSPALWEVSGPNGARGWLFGTVHALPDGAEWRTPVLDRALDEAGLLVVEVANLDDAEGARAAFAARARGRDLPPLLQRVPADERGALAALLARAKRPERTFDHVETWAAALQLAGAVRESDPGNGTDRALLRLGKPAIGLESFAAQYSLFDGLPESDQTDLLVGTVHEAAAGRSEARLTAWLMGDMEALERDAYTGILDYPRLREALLDSRNRQWTGQIDALLQGGRKPFVAVGAAHMLGGEGLPALLADRGYEVRRMQ